MNCFFLQFPQIKQCNRNFEKGVKNQMCSECTSGMPEVGAEGPIFLQNRLPYFNQKEQKMPPTLVSPPPDFQTNQYPCTFKAKCSDAVWRQ